jgi:hypothetical protein
VPSNVSNGPGEDLKSFTEEHALSCTMSSRAFRELWPFFFDLDEEMLRQAAQCSKTPGMEIPMLKLHVIKLPAPTNKISPASPRAGALQDSLSYMSKELLDSLNSEASSPGGTDVFVSQDFHPVRQHPARRYLRKNQGSNDLHKPCRMALALEKW